MISPKLHDRKYSILIFVISFLSIIALNLIHSYRLGCNPVTCAFSCKIPFTIGKRSFCLVDAEPDSPGYIAPWLYWETNGIYWDDYRTPVYGLFYFMGRMLSKEHAALIVYVIQLVFLSFSYTIISKYVNNRIRIIVIFLFMTLPLSFYYPLILLTESLTASFLIIGAVSFMNRKYTVTGLTFALSAMMKPVFFTVLLVTLFYLVFIEWKREPLRSIALYGLFPLLIIGSWTLRNYHIYNELRFMHGSGTAISPVLLSDDLIRAQLSFRMNTGLMGFQQYNEYFCIPSWIIKATGYSDKDMDFLLFEANPVQCDDRLYLARKIEKAEYNINKYYGSIIIIKRVYETIRSLLPIKSNGYYQNDSKKIRSTIYIITLSFCFLGIFIEEKARFMSLISLTVIGGYAIMGTGGYRYWEPVMPVMITSAIITILSIKKYLLSRYNDNPK